MTQSAGPNTYAASGVNIDEGTRAVELMKAAVRGTHGPEVLAGVGAFGGMFDISALKSMDSPVLVASTDGVGTKTKIAAQLNRWDSVGQDLVNHCINDILVQDVAGTIVGVVDRAAAVTGERIQAGDVIVGLPSNGLHTNGYSLARRALAGLDWRAPWNGTTVGDALLAVHRPYLAQVAALRAAGLDIRGMAHITGGGLVDNFPRVLPEGLSGVFHPGQWPVPPIFELIQELGQVPPGELYRAFNMGIGLCVVLPAADAARALAALPGDAYIAGEIVRGSEPVVIAGA
jgi:phosphoribosylformylglycinamidine cyclo-ligase